MPGKGPTIVRAVTDQREMEAALRLRYEAYRRKGYVSARQSGAMTDEWDALPGTVHFVAIVNDLVVATVRLVSDGERGLPMERVFGEEVDALRAQGRKIAEASALVVEPGRGNGRAKTWLALSRAVWKETLAQGLDDLCVAVTKSHLAFYGRLLFEAIGMPRPYRSLRGVLAYPLRLEVGKARDERAGADDGASVDLRCSLRGEEANKPERK